MRQTKNRQFIRLGALVVLLVLALAIGVQIISLLPNSATETPMSLAPRQSSTQVEVAEDLPLQPLVNLASPLPIPTPASELNIPKSEGWIVTPLPEQEVRVGQPAEIEKPTAAPILYEVANPMAERVDRLSSILTITNTVTGRHVQIGDENTSVELNANDDRYIVFAVFCEPCKELKRGMYLYELSTDTKRFITDKVTASPYAKLAESWVVYPYIPNPKPTHFGAKAQLLAFNIQTDETILVSDNFFWPLSGVEDRFAIGGNKVAWFTGPPEQTLHAYDLSIGQESSIKLPFNTNIPRYLSVQDDVILWLDAYWHGYDLEHSAYFVIPVVPSGWENVNIDEFDPIRVQNHQLSWGLQNKGEWHYFTAPLVMKDSDSVSS